MTEWPDPQPDPAVEPGENPEGHLLPDLPRLRTLSPAQRAELLGLVADWEGDHVEEFRRRVRAL